MKDGREPLLLSLLLFPFRLFGFMVDLAWFLWLLVIGGGLVALFAFFLWHLWTGGPG